MYLMWKETVEKFLVFYFNIIICIFNGTVYFEAFLCVIDRIVFLRNFVIL